MIARLLCWLGLHHWVDGSLSTQVCDRPWCRGKTQRDYPWPKPTVEGLTLHDGYQPWITYHYPYSDEEAMAMGGRAVIDAHCTRCGAAERNVLLLGATPEQDVYPANGISDQRAAFMAAHRHHGHVTSYVLDVGHR